MSAYGTLLENNWFSLVIQMSFPQVRTADNPFCCFLLAFSKFGLFTLSKEMQQTSGKPKNRKQVSPPAHSLDSWHGLGSLVLFDFGWLSRSFHKYSIKCKNTTLLPERINRITNMCSLRVTCAVGKLVKFPRETNQNPQPNPLKPVQLRSY